MEVIMEKQKAFLNHVEHAHREQKRKYTNEPYINHLTTVASLSIHYSTTMGYDYKHVYEIAIGHDLMEDTYLNDSKTLKTILISCGYAHEEAMDIINGIINLTDKYTKQHYPDLNREERKILEAYRLSKIPKREKLIKLSDIFDNSSSILQYDPNFSKVYIPEKKNILNLFKEECEYWPIYQKCSSLITITNFKNE